MPKAIGPSDTIETVLPKLRDPERYLAGVIKKLDQCQKENGNAFVRIGVTGSGQYPCYRIVHEQVYGAFTDNHMPFPTAGSDTFWSKSAMTLDEVIKLQAKNA